ncbi:bacteriohemerythrin [Clostridium thailandense]|uniref:Hemerythrin family protein n=1 Tax=Clostridium thailandense TaxID=2794346 RepID=A0A949TG23_9CLOT|nr:bacteriohemerythrin [Clostridium thailandense]MBV7272139.1 hemerythrin family protein [Clostridium thailandense]MCH5136009.1 hemerythrin family protein [Clostridiaceae bacterium UIB06]
MLLKWDDSFLVGVEKIDNQHKELFEIINKFLTAMIEGKGKSEITTTLNFLESYVIKHFNEEERLLIDRNKEAYDIQFQQHEAFKNEIIKLKDRFSKSGITSTLVIETQKSVTSWCRNHIIKIDKELASFMKD